MATIPQRFETAPPAAGTAAAAEEARRRMAALKARRSLIEPTPEGFQFDPNEPLRLKKPAKK
jgi:hypothetical protein